MKIQWQKLKILLEHSFRHVPYYKKLFNDLKITPNDIRSEEDFKQLPQLTKRIIQKNYHDLIAENFKPKELNENATGGSSGEMMIFYQDVYRNDLRRGYVLRHDSWTGWKVGEKIALIWGSDRDIPNHRNLKTKMRMKFLERKLWLNAFDLNEKKVIGFAKKLQKYKPSMIIGYANALYLFYKFVSNNQILLPSVKGIISSAETLYKYQRTLIESVSGSKIYNRFGCREVGLIASECPYHNGLHLNAENIYFEINNDKKLKLENDMGEVIVTDLLNFGMPLIRYNMKDIVKTTNRACECGRGLPLIDKVSGRTSDMIMTKDGSFIHGEYFTHLFYGIPGIKKFQLVQKKNWSIIIEIECDFKLDESKFDFIKDKVKNTVPNNDVILKIVDKINVPASGKHQFTISEINHM